ncbi:MAG: hypothetical protein JW891_17375 [Candidatus Lokiarchaeota archaeon]|nr:hypothetical protein [Candidatus Lokiarchaeota archaeon]
MNPVERKYYSERKTCLLCKNKVSGFIYKCKCGSYYCDYCVRAFEQIQCECLGCERLIKKYLVNTD